MKTMKIYKTPVCEVYHLRMDMEELCNGGMGMYNSFTDIQGVKEAHRVFDDEAKENPEDELYHSELQRN